MTVKPKDIIFFTFIAALSAVALGYGLSVTPSPTEQKNLKLDHERIKDIEQLSFGIEDYYTDKYYLPSSTNELSSIYGEYINDPETKKPYEYSATGAETYKLCATFNTDSSKVKPKTTDRYGEDYNYTGEKGKFVHAKGYKCFEFTLPESLMPAPTFTCLGAECPRSSPISDSPSTTTGYFPKSTAKAELSSLDKTGPCRWIARFSLKEFTPNSPITIDSRGSLSDKCNPAKTHEYGWAEESKIKTSNDGTAIIEYAHSDYGTYNYTFTDENGYAASVKVQYSLSPTPTASY